MYALHTLCAHDTCDVEARKLFSVDVWEHRTVSSKDIWRMQDARVSFIRIPFLVGMSTNSK